MNIPLDMPFLLGFIWIAACIGASILYRKRLGKPLFPRAPRNAVFAEGWRSGRSLDSLLKRMGGARNCLLVYVADNKLTIVPNFPFNLMFLPEIYGLEIAAPISDVDVEIVDGLFGERVQLTINKSAKRFELSLRDSKGFQAVIEGKRT